MAKKSCPSLSFSGSTKLFGSCLHPSRVSTTQGMAGFILINLCSEVSGHRLCYYMEVHRPSPDEVEFISAYK